MIKSGINFKEMEVIMGFQECRPVILAIAFSVLIGWFFRRIMKSRKLKSSSGLPLPPEIPGLPVLGNLHQLKEKNPHKTFARWALKYGPIYSIRTGSKPLLILNSTGVAKEAMVTRFSSISTRKLSNAMQIISDDKNIVAVADYGEFHKMVKRNILTSTLGPNAQKRHRIHRDSLMENMSELLHACLKKKPLEAVCLRKVLQSVLFGLALKEAIGNDLESDSVYMEELGTTLSRDEIFQILVIDPMKAAIEVDWRDFFPYLRWIPNRTFDKNMQKMCLRRQAVMNHLINEQKKRISRGEGVNSYLDYLLSEGQTLSERQISMMIWEVIIESSDTILGTIEWAMYELAKDPLRQDRLYQDIKNICGDEKITEEKISELPYLSAVFHETLRKYSPAPVIPIRYVHEDTQLGGYHIPAGTEIAINIYGCNMDKNVWESPDDWNPERFIDGKYDAMDMYKTMAFGAGRRVCAGSLQAMLIFCTAIGQLLQQFEWKLMDGEEEKVDMVGLTMHKLHPMNAIIKARN